MKQSLHTITIEPLDDLSFGTRVALDAATAILWPLKPDDKLTALITLLADAIYDVAETDDQIDAIVDTLRMQLKMFLADAPPLRSN